MRVLPPPPGGLYPVYLQDLFNFRSTMYNLRDSEIKLDLPKPRTNYYNNNQSGSYKAIL